MGKRSIKARKSLRPDAARVRAVRPGVVIAAVLVAAVAMGALYLRFAWDKYQNAAVREAFALAQALGAALSPEAIEKLAADSDRAHLPEYRALKGSLIRLADISGAIYHVVVLYEQDGEIAALADSASGLQPASWPDSRSCAEAARLDRQPFQTGRSAVSEPYVTPCGVWRRVLVPIAGTGPDGSFAVLGLSFSAPEWRAALVERMLPDFIVVAGLMLLTLLLIRLWLDRAGLRRKSRQLSAAKDLYHSIFEHAPIGIALLRAGQDALPAAPGAMNPMAEKILGGDGHPPEDDVWPEIIGVGGEPSGQPGLLQDETGAYRAEKRIIRPDGSQAWLNVKITEFSNSALHDFRYLSLIEDVTARVRAQEALFESERSKAVFLAHIPGMAYRCKYDESWTMEFVSEGCRGLTGYAPESIIGSRDLAYADIICPEYKQFIAREWGRVLLHKVHFHCEYEIITRSGVRKWVLEMGQGVYDADGDVEALEGIVLDVSDQKKREARIAYLSEHDFLTGLYNWSHLEKELQRMDQPQFRPLSVAVCDINGLRMVNDAYGLAEGDRLIVTVAEIIEKLCRPGDALGRIGGGKFMLLLPRTENREAHQIKKAIKSAVEHYNRAQTQPLYEISVSVGHDTKRADSRSINETVTVAEEYLERRKLLNQKSSHHALISSVLATLYAKSQETEEHGKRLAQLTCMVGARLGLGQKELDDLQLLSMLHDIGKIGVDDAILNNPGKLTAVEWEIMKGHTEIGHRIAMSTPQLEHIAEYILCHHERWDGKGYPRGLAGRAIPLVSRILAVVDAYDAMTQTRVYKQAISRPAALEEIIQCAGTQFDPHIARQFVEMMREHPEY